MSDHSAIEWTDATWNPVTGCTRVSPGCAHCYIERTPPFRMAGRRFALVRSHDPGAIFESSTGVTLHADRLEQPLHWRKTRRVFVCSLADLFHDEVPDYFIRDVLGVIACAPEHTFQILTKRPERALELLGDRNAPVLCARQAAGRGLALDHHFDRWPLPNVWVGVSIENARYTWRADVLREIPAAVRFISAEPLLDTLVPKHCGNSCYPMGPPGGSYMCGRAAGHGGLHRSEYGDGCEWDETHCWIGRDTVGRYAKPLDLTGIDWVIMGGESGPGARPFHLEHAREIIVAARLERGRRYDADEHDHSPAVFVKQLGAKPLGRTMLFDPIGTSGFAGRWGEAPMKLRDSKGGDIEEWPADLRIREFPAVAA